MIEAKSSLLPRRGRLPRPGSSRPWPPGPTAKERLAAAQETLRLSQERKEFGIAAVLEQILAEQDLTRARNDYVTAVADFDKAQYALLRATGARPESGQEPR